MTLFALPPGWTARVPTMDDAPAAYELLVACDTAVLGVADVALGDVEADLAQGPESQTVLIDGDRLRGWVWLLDKAAGRTLADVYLDPTLPTDLGDRLAASAWTAVRERTAGIATARQVGLTSVEVGSLEGDTTTERRLTAAGFVRERTFWRMSRTLTADDRQPVVAPGLTIRPVGEVDLRVMHDVMERSFGDHWGHVPRSYDDWWAQVSTGFGFELELCWLAVVDGDPVGLLIGSAQMAEEDAIYVATLGTTPAARGRGVAKSLLRQAFAAGVERGWGHAKLNVDSQNTTPALDLYLRVGMQVEFAMHAWRLEVEAT